MAGLLRCAATLAVLFCGAAAATLAQAQAQTPQSGWMDVMLSDVWGGWHWPPRLSRTMWFWERHDLPLFGMGMVTAIGVFFLFLWLMRRKEVAYGWLGLTQGCWLLSQWGLIAPTNWPFTSTAAFEACTRVALLVFSGCFMMFVLRICRRRWPRREAAVWGLIALGCVAALLAPDGVIDVVRVTLTLAMAAHYILFSVLFMWFAWRDGRLDERILSVYGLVNIVVAVHDMPGFAGGYWYTPGTIITVTFVALVLGRNFANNLGRIEGFNAELQCNVEKARTELAAALQRQHELELLYARLGERVGLAHDLHDGLGGMLIHNIAMLEQAPRQLPSRQVLGMFHEMRDDLRLIIDTASAQHYGEHSLADLVGPLRHRMTQMLEAHGIALHWRVSGVEKVYPTTTQSLDLLRILQEALTNVLKHSGASLASVDLYCAADTLTLEIKDNGAGFETSEVNGLGIGMRSMHARAQRLGAALTIRSTPGDAGMRLSIPWPESQTNAGAKEISPKPATVSAFLI